MKLIKMRIWTCLMLSYLGIASLSFAANESAYSIKVQGSDLADINQVKNCIDYTVCQYAKSWFSHGPSLFVMAIQVRLNPSELTVVEQRCLSPYRSQFLIDVRRTNSKEPILPSVSHASSRVDPTRASPIYLARKTAQSNQMNLDQISRLIQNKKYDDAIAFAASAFNIDFAEYQAKYGGDASMATYAVAQHNTTTIEIGKFFFKDACSLVMAIRHEAEHIQQVKRKDECESRGKVSALKDHLYRERSAHLNDIFNLRQFCTDTKALDGQIESRLKYLFEKYGNHAPLNY